MAFSFHANTLAFGGQVEDPSFDGASSRRFLPSQASVTLPPEGGYGESSISNFSQDGVSFYRAESRVYGSSFRNQLFKTYANVTVYGLDINGVIQADVLSAGVTSINRREKDCTSESRISFDAAFVGLVIAGHPYDVELDTQKFLEAGTFSEFTDNFSRLGEEQARATADLYNWPFDECRTKTVTGESLFHVPARCNNGLRATALRDIRPSLPDSPKLRRQGFTIEVPNLGLVHLAEVMLNVGRRGINLLRVEVGQTLESLIVPPTPAPDEPRPFALALAAQPLGPGGSSGGYTVVHATGNGTDYGPP
jgi:hypothetical protein